MLDAYDIVIVGLGPSGSVLAKHLSPGHRILAIDKKDGADTGFKKPCGGLLAPDAQKALSRFDMTLPKDILSNPQIFSVKTMDMDSGCTRHYQRHYINMDRHSFDLWLTGQIPPNVDLCKGANCTHISKTDGGFEVRFLINGETRKVKTKYIVGADGANSIVRKMLYPNFKVRRYLSIQQWYKDTHASPFYSCIFDSDITDSYCWALTKNEHFIFGGAFDVKTGKRDFERIKEKLCAYGFHLEEPIKTEACMVLRPYGLRNCCYGTHGAFFIGEAAGFISPSSLEGISYAIESAGILAGCLNDAKADPNVLYRKGTRKIRMRIFFKLIKSPFMYHPFLRRLIMRSGITSIKVMEEEKLNCQGKGKLQRENL